MTTTAGPAFSVQTDVPTAAGMAELGGRLARLLAAGDLVVLSGPLGAGKTTLTQGIGAGLNVRGPVTSPTFVIARVHPSLAGGPDLVHADAYRLGSRAEVDDLDLDADLATSVTVVEWGEGLVEALAGSYLAIGIEPVLPAPGPGAPGPGAPGPGAPVPGAPVPGATVPGGTVAPPHPGAAAGDGTGSENDEPRTVRIDGWGERWQQAAGRARQALAHDR